MRCTCKYARKTGVLIEKILILKSLITHAIIEIDPLAIVHKTTPFLSECSLPKDHQMDSGYFIGYVMSIKYVKGFNKFYCISDNGRVWSRYIRGSDNSKRKGKWRRLKFIKQSSGHLMVGLYLDGKQYRRFVHSLVLETFIGPCPKKLECRHLDGNPANNKIENLKWDTHKENMEDRVSHGTSNRGERCGTSKLTKNKIIEIRRLYFTKKYTQRKLAKIFDVTQQHISDIVNKKIWKHLI